MNTAMVDICLNCQVTHNLVVSILVKTMAIESPLFCKINYWAECISNFLKDPVTSSIFS